MIDVGSVKHRIKEFDQRNGGNPVLSGEFYLYSNGAMRDYNPLGGLVEPPTDEFQRLTNVVNYHKARLAVAVNAFQDLREQLLHSASGQDQELVRLRGLKGEVEKCRKALNKAEAALAQTDTAKARAGVQESIAERRLQHVAWRSQVRDISIAETSKTEE